MSSPPPTKPPRGVKQGKETSGLLMSVIRTLSASETNEQREKERIKLEKEYKKSDARLDELVAAHDTEVMEVMQKYETVSGALAAWGAREEAARARLAACQGLLRVKLDDLQRLWRASRTYHHALNMLTDIEKVVNVERDARAAISRGHLLAASTLLAEALKGAGTLSVPALDATVRQLKTAETELVERLHRELCTALFAAPAIDLQRQGSTKRRIAALLAELTKSEEVADTCLEEITPEFETRVAVDERSFETHLTILLEALAVLGHLGEATEKFKVSMQNELLEVVSRESRALQLDEELETTPDIDNDPALPLPLLDTQDGRTVWRLLWRLHEAWCSSGERTSRAGDVWRAALLRHSVGTTALYSHAHYWSAVQQVMQLVISEYVGMESVRSVDAATNPGVNATVATELPISDYFGKKRPNRRRVKLYTMTDSSAPQPVIAVSRAQRYPVLVTARPELLAVALPPLRALVTHIEKQVGGGACSLRVFVSEYVRGGGAERAGQGARGAVEAATGDPARWTEQHSLGSRRVYSCAVTAWQAIDQARAWSQAASYWAGGAGLAVLPALKDLLRHAGHAHGAARSSHAARWLADDDIVRFLRNLPNWRAATQKEDAPSPAELEQAYEREAEILGASLADAELRPADLMRGPDKLVHHALMCETAGWLAERTRELPISLARHSKLPDGLLSEINSTASRFEEIAHKCLLFLHLEIRIQCFYHLGRESSRGQDGADEASGQQPGAARLAAALLTLHDHVAPVLARKRLQYVLCGIGEMMSAGIVWRWQGEGGTAAAEASLAPLRHALAALGAGGAGLSKAAAYLQLLSAHPRDIIDAVRARGPKFTELEYLNALKHIGGRLGLSQNDMRPYLDALEQALAGASNGR